MEEHYQEKKRGLNKQSADNYASEIPYMPEQDEIDKIRKERNELKKKKRELKEA